MPIRPDLPAVKNANILFLDTETGGLSPVQCDIIEIGCVLTDPSGRTVLEEWEACVIPRRPVEPEAARLNGYDAEKWASVGVSLPVAMVKVLELARGAVMCCHNTPFDKAFVDAALLACGQRWTGRYHTLDTVAMSSPLLRRGLVNDVKLDTLATFFGLDMGKGHRALPDARRCRGVYLSLQDIFEPAIDAYVAARQGRATGDVTA